MWELILIGRRFGRVMEVETNVTGKYFRSSAQDLLEMIRLFGNNMEFVEFWECAINILLKARFRLELILAKGSLTAFKVVDFCNIQVFLPTRRSPCNGDKGTNVFNLPISRVIFNPRGRFCTMCISKITIFVLASTTLISASLISYARASDKNMPMRSFYMAVYDDSVGKYGDFAFIWIGPPMPKQKNIILQINPNRNNDKYHYDSSKSAWLQISYKILDTKDAINYLLSLVDWNGKPYFSIDLKDNSNIYAINVDEPYWDENPSSPCTSNGARFMDTLYIKNTLMFLARAVHILAPMAHFWVNYSQPEVAWMESSCNIYNIGGITLNLNSSLFDIVSVDYYVSDFQNSLLPVLNILKSSLHNTKSCLQQLALVASARRDSGASRELLESIIEYSTQKDSECIPMQRRAEQDDACKACPISLIAAWNAWGWSDYYIADHPGVTFNPYGDPCSSDADNCIYHIWTENLALPIREMK